MNRAPRIRTATTLATVVLAIGGACTAAVSPNPILTRGLTPYGSPSSALSNLNDGKYVKGSWASGSGSWVAYHLNSAPSRVVVAWNNPSYTWSDTVLPPSPATHECTQTEGSDLTYPLNYEFSTSSNSTNGTDGNWTSRLKITDNRTSSRSHILQTGGDAWIKMSIIAAVGSAPLDEFDVYDASNSTDDTWLFMGTSISAHTYKKWAQPSDFQHLVEASSPGNTPAVVKAGIPCIYSTDVSKYIKNYLAYGSSCHFWAIEMGTNDAWGGGNGSVQSFTDAMQLIIDSAKAHGIRPMIARTLATDLVAGFSSVQTTYTKSPPWQVNPAFLTAIDNLTSKNGLVAGPDLYTYFVAHPTQHLDGVHPDSTGAAAIQRLWAEAMLKAVYTPAAAASPVDKMLLEAETAQLAVGAATVQDAARSNGAYVNLQGGSITWTDSLTKAGTYDLSLQMASPYGPKVNTFSVDGDSTAFTVDSSVAYGPVTVSAARVLKAGKHTFKVAAQWGWISVDYLKLSAPSAVLPHFDRVFTPVARRTADGIWISGIDGIRQIRAMDVFGKTLAVSDPRGSSTTLPMDARGIIFLSFEDATGRVTNSKLVLP